MPYSICEVPQWVCASNLPVFETVIAPDAGAKSKAALHTSVSSCKSNLVCLSKTRTELGIVYDDLAFENIVGTACVVDDICDGGATFISLAQMLRRTQPQMTSLNLYVTHGIFSKGFYELMSFYDKIYVSNMMFKKDYNKERIICI